MTKDDQLHLFTLYKIKEFPRAGEQLLFVVIVWPGLTILGEEALHHDRINGQQNRAGLRQAHQYRLMPGCVPAGFQQG
jgi:hypothetical protein